MGRGWFTRCCGGTTNIALGVGQQVAELFPIVTQHICVRRLKQIEDGLAQGSIEMVVHQRRNGGGAPPGPPDQGDHSGKKRNLPLEKSCWAIFGTQILGPRPHPPLF